MIVDFGNDDILDIAKAIAIGKQLTEMLADASFNYLIIDFQSVQLITSSVIGELLNVKEKCGEGGVELFLCGMTEDLAALFKRLKLERVFTVYESRQLALRAAGELQG